MQNSKTENSIEERLPLTITSIKPQKKRKNRVSLFHEDLFLMGISIRALELFPVRTGTKLTPTLFKKLRNTEAYQQIRDTFYDYLARRDHTAFELRQKARKKGFQQDQAEDIIREFSQKNLLNDDVFAKKFAADKAEFRKWGPLKIKHALIRKGIDKNVAEKSIQFISEGLEQAQICVDLALKRKRYFLREENSVKRKQKIYNYLVRKGYPDAVVKNALPEILKSIDA